ncbi:acyl-CoA dehydrogenase family protein [Pseudogulbenkiania sp. MAI-1]|uniref:acyl-CoA dehydrogenase family protein n=1 Tax=Pseudogulbenkiania sp. MAI-1 TaxID=990370 RepID=UPI00045E78D5|nr:acyl-CoA dehydrogenase family protein [Pseudogulbenkiania sp. MAI-1]
MQLDIEDTRQLLEEVGHFARERIASQASRPESPLGPETLAQLTEEARALGILPQSPLEEGFGIWENSEDAQALGFSAGALRLIAHACPGVAFAWHRMALARFVAVALKLRLNEHELQGVLLAPTGHYGLARTSLGKWLRGAPLRQEDLTLLADWLDSKANAVTLCAARDWSSILRPVWHDDHVAWQLVARNILDVRTVPLHGFDELTGFVVRQPVAGGQTVELDAQRSRLLYGRLLKLDLLGLLAIGAGALDRGQEWASDYAAIRKQGGKAIIGHPAVQHMLSDIVIARQQADLALARFGSPLDELDLGSVAATRASIGTALCHAANQVIQIHGGIGYMRDAGPEKLVRDQNMLKFTSGGVRDIPSFLAGWYGAY